MRNRFGEAADTKLGYEEMYAILDKIWDRDVKFAHQFPETFEVQLGRGSFKFKK